MRARCGNRIPLSPRRTGAGFTLVEMMVAVALMALIVLITAKVFTEASEITSIASARVEISQNARVILDRIEAELRGAFLEQGREDFVGTASTIRFVTSVDWYDTSSTNNWARNKRTYYYLDSEVMKTWSDRTTTENGSGDRELGFNVEYLSFQYIDGDGDPRDTWRLGTDSWASSPAGNDILPAAVKVTLRLSDAEERVKQTVVRVIALG